MMKRQDTKTCVVCNRPMTWRRKWARTWDQVKYCSNACRRNKLKTIDLPTAQSSQSRVARTR